MRALLFSAMLVGCGAAPSLVPPRNAPPSSRDALLALAANGALDPSDPSCSGVTGDLDDETLRTIEAHLLGQLADAESDGDTGHLAVSCTGSEAPWSCTLDVRIEGEDPWHYGITFRLDAAGAIDAGSVRCPGGS